MSRGCLRTTISFSEWLIASITPESAKISPLLKKYESVCELAIPKRLTRAEIAMSKAATLWTLLCWIPIAERKTRLTGMKNCSKVTRASFGMTAVGQNSKNVYIKSTVLHERDIKREERNLPNQSNISSGHLLIPFDLEKLVKPTWSLLRLQILQSQVNQKVERENHYNRDVGKVICFDRSDEEAVPLHH